MSFINNIVRVIIQMSTTSDYAEYLKDNTLHNDKIVMVKKH